MVAQAEARGTDGERRQAESRLAEARALYESNDDEAALEKLEEAYALYPSPKVHLLFGHVYRGLGYDGRALAAYDRFLVEASDADAGERREAERVAAQLRRRLAFLTVGTDGAGAEVEVDGEVVGRTPLRAPVVLTRGLHQVVVRAPGYAPFTRTLRTAGGDRMHVHARMTPLGSGRVSPHPATEATQVQFAARTRWIWGATAVATATAAVATLLILTGADDGCPQCTLGLHEVKPPR